MSSKVKIALVQLSVTSDKNDNLSNAFEKIKLAADKGSQIIALPECFNTPYSPYGGPHFSNYAEKIPGESTSLLSKAAKENNVYIVGGSIPEFDNGKIYNTCTVWGPDGSMLAKYRKMHLADIEITGKIAYRESDTISPGNSLATFDHPLCKVGIGICFDLRFPEMAQIYAKKGCQLLVYPAAFNTVTGPLHLEALQRGRALDNQVYVAYISPARDVHANYQSWGHSMLIDPFGAVVATTEEKEDIVYAELDMDYIEKVRRMIPLRGKRREDIYSEVEEK